MNLVTLLKIQCVSAPSIWWHISSSETWLICSGFISSISYQHIIHVWVVWTCYCSSMSLLPPTEIPSPPGAMKTGNCNGMTFSNLFYESGSGWAGLLNNWCKGLDKGMFHRDSVVFSGNSILVVRKFRAGFKKWSGFRMRLSGGQSSLVLCRGLTVACCLWTPVKWGFTDSPNIDFTCI